MSFLEQNTIRKRGINELNNELLEPGKTFKTGDHKDYRVKAIIDGAVNGQETNSQISSLYYLVL